MLLLGACAVGFIMVIAGVVMMGAGATAAQSAVKHIDEGSSPEQVAQAERDAQVAVAGGMGGGFLLALMGCVVAWVATGPIGVGWLASCKGRDGALWAVAAFILPLITFVAILVAGEEREKVVYVRDRPRR